MFEFDLKHDSEHLSGSNYIKTIYSESSRSRNSDNLTSQTWRNPIKIRKTLTCSWVFPSKSNTGSHSQAQNLSEFKLMLYLMSTSLTWLKLATWCAAMLLENEFRMFLSTTCSLIIVLVFFTRSVFWYSDPSLCFLFSLSLLRVKYVQRVRLRGTSGSRWGSEDEEESLESNHQNWMSFRPSGDLIREGSIQLRWFFLQ